MDVRIEAAPMAAQVEVVTPVVIASVNLKALSQMPERVASFSCPSLGSHSISAVAPDHNFMNGGLARAA